MNPDIVSWIDSSGQHAASMGMYKEERGQNNTSALVWHTRMQEQRVLMSNIYASSGQWKNVAKVRQQMKDDGVRKIPGISNIEVGGKDT